MSRARRVGVAMVAVVVVAVICWFGLDGRTRDGDYAVGTYIGAGSFLFGPSECTYEGASGVFDDGPGSAKGPRLIVGPGTIKVHCPKVELEGEAIEPTALKIHGPPTIDMRGSESRIYAASLVASDRDLGGRVDPEWTLGPDCEGVADFGPVLGAQDTGGADRTRTVVPKKPGRCTLTARVTTGSETLHPSFKGKTFQASMTITIAP